MMSGPVHMSEIAELVEQLRGTATGRQVESPRLGVAVNTGGIMGGRDAALVAVHVLERN